MPSTLWSLDKISSLLLHLRYVHAVMMVLVQKGQVIVNSELANVVESCAQLASKSRAPDESCARTRKVACGD